MAAAQYMGLCLVSSGGTKLSPKLFHISIMSSSSAFPNELRSHRVVLNKCGSRSFFGTRDAEAGRKNYGAGGGKLRDRGSSLPCTCLLDRNFSAKSYRHAGIQTEVIPLSSGSLLRLKSICGEVSVCTVYQTKCVGRIGSQRMRSRARLGGDEDVDINGDVVAEDYYSVLGLVVQPLSNHSGVRTYLSIVEALLAIRCHDFHVCLSSGTCLEKTQKSLQPKNLCSFLTPDATPEEIKKAYYACMKACHPDLSGNDASVTSFCSFVNEIYEVLSDPEQRLIYDEINGYTLTAINPFNDTSAERDHAFVDEFTCIGCKNCAHTAPDTFDIEEEFGRARVISQTGNPVLVERAIQTCPVDCIHWTSAQQLTLLEDEMRRVERVNVGLMLSGMGFQSPDVFTQASWRWEKRQAKAVERARVRMMKEGGKSGKEAWWNVNWGSAADEKSSKAAANKYARERAAKTAAAARRWREYSRRGVDRRAIRILASESAAKAQEDVDKEKARVN